MTQISPDIDVLIDLVSTESVSGNEQHAAARFVHHAQDRGFISFIDEVHNAIAHRGAQPETAHTHIVLLGHIDTVPGHIDVRIENGILYGRGSVDAKGPLAAMLCAAAKADIPNGVCLTVVGAAGEETAHSPGARHILHRYTPDACIVGEPSGWDGVTLGYKGRLLLTATATIPSHHSAGPEPSASDIVTNWWNRAQSHIDSINTGKNGIFYTVQATIQKLHSTNDGITDTASMTAGFRLPPSTDPHTLATQLTALQDINVLSFDITGHEIAHCTERNDLVVRALSSSIRAAGARPRPKYKTGTADFNLVGPVWNCPIAAYGPGDSELDHTPNEHIRLDEYERSIDILISTLKLITCMEIAL